jgi:hypothetical protein
MALTVKRVAPYRIAASNAAIACRAASFNRRARRSYRCALASSRRYSHTKLHVALPVPDFTSE